jgi:predicted RNase H-like HicB family nuclease
MFPIQGTFLSIPRYEKTEGVMGMVVVRTVIEYNENGFLAHVQNYCGAYTRGKTRVEALGKLRGEIASYTLWATGEYLLADEPLEIKVVQEKLSHLQICDADTEVLFSTEKLPLSQEEYASLKSLVIRSGWTILPRRPWMETALQRL